MKRFPFCLMIAVVLIAGSVGACRARDVATTGTVFVTEAPEVAALAPLPDGGLVIGERRTGRIREIDSRGHDRALLATVATTSEGQRGLLGLAVDRGRRVFATWTDPAGLIVVGQVAPGPERTVWIGPQSTDLANGGHLEFVGDGLVVGIGDLQQPPRTSDPSALNGKLLRLDPDGAADQAPGVISSSWNNPFAFTSLAGRLWVADNAFGARAERLARGDRGTATSITPLPADTAPSGLAPLGRDGLALCSFLREELTSWRLDDRGRMEPTGVLARGCKLGVVQLTGGRFAFSTGTTIRVVTP